MSTLRVHKQSLPKRIRMALIVLFTSIFIAIYVISNVPHNRFQITQNLQLVDQPIVHNGGLISEFVATIANNGKYDAKNVRIVLSVNNGTLVRTLVKSQEPFITFDTPLPNRTQELFWVNLVSGTNIQIAIWTSSPSKDVPSIPQLHTSFYGGSIRSSSPTTRTDDPGLNLFDGPMIIWQAFHERFVQTGFLDELPTMAEHYGIYHLYQINLRKQEFIAVTIVIFTAAFIIKVFLSRKSSAIVYLLLISSFLWLFTNITMNINWILVVVGILSLLASRLTKNLTFRILFSVISTPLILIYIFDTPIQNLKCVAHTVDLFCPPVSVPAALVLGYSVFAMYLLFDELRHNHIS